MIINRMKLQRAISYLHIAVIVGMPLLNPGFTAGAKPACSRGQVRDRVFLGGLNGFQSLSHSEATKEFRQTGRARLYFHYSATDPKISGQSLPVIAKLFQDLPELVEIEIFHSGFLSEEWQTIILASGLHPKAAVVNADLNALSSDDREQRLLLFKSLANEGFKAGLNMLAPVVTPNDYQSMQRPFADPFWDQARSAALFGRGIAFDTPPEFYLRESQPSQNIRQYQTFIKDAIHWSCKVGPTSIVILSPRSDVGHFREDAWTEYKKLDLDGTLPRWLVLKNYDLPAAIEAAAGRPTPDFTAIGTERDNDSVARTALDFAHLSCNSCQ